MLEFQSRRGRREEGEKREKEEKRGCLPPLLEKEKGFTVKGGGVEKDRGVGGERKEGSGGGQADDDKSGVGEREEAQGEERGEDE